MAARPRVSAVVVAYRSGEALTRCLESVLAAPAVREVIVVDNGDGGPEIEAARRSRRRSGASSRHENLGYGGGCNAGAAEARGDVLLFLNADTEVDAGAPEALATALTDRRHRRRGAAHRPPRRPGAPELGRQRRPRDRPRLAGSLGRARRVRRGAPGRRLRQRLRPRRSAPRPSAKLGGFAEELFLYQEDLELSWRARLAGLRVVVEPAATVAPRLPLRPARPREALLARAEPARLRPHRVLRPAARVARADPARRRDRPRRPCPTRRLVAREARAAGSGSSGTARRWRGSAAGLRPSAGSPTARPPASSRTGSIRRCARCRKRSSDSSRSSAPTGRWRAGCSVATNPG